MIKEDNLSKKIINSNKLKFKYDKLFKKGNKKNVFLKSNQFIMKDQSPLNNSISVVANHIITNQTNDDVRIAIFLVEQEMKNQNVNIENLRRLNLFLCKGGEFSIQVTNPGNQIQFSVINCDFVEKLEYQFR